MVDEEFDTTFERSEPIVDVGQVYKAPMTVRERLEDEQRRSDEAHRLRLPHYPSAKLGFIAGVLTLLALFFLHNLESLLMSGSIALISLAFLIALVLTFFIWLYGRYAARMLYLFDLSPVAYVSIVALVCWGAVGSGLYFSDTVIGFSVVAVVSALVTMIITRVLLVGRI